MPHSISSIRVALVHRALTKTSRRRRRRTVGAALGRGCPPRRPAAGRRPGRQRTPGCRTLSANEQTEASSHISKPEGARIEGNSAGTGAPTDRRGMVVMVGGAYDGQRRLKRPVKGTIVVMVWGRVRGGSRRGWG
jgi:hypothetical protein